MAARATDSKTSTNDNLEKSLDEMVVEDEVVVVVEGGNEDEDKVERIHEYGDKENEVKEVGSGEESPYSRGDSGEGIKEVEDDEEGMAEEEIKEVGSKEERVNEDGVSEGEVKEEEVKDEPPKEEVVKEVKGSNNMMGGDWRKVISARRGATCSVEVILRMKGSEVLAQDRKDEREYCTGSHFAGEVDAVNMQGECSYTMPHGVLYEGVMQDGRCVGTGTLTYPHMGRVDGTFNRGKLAPITYTFSDGLVYELVDWNYCSCDLPDRRFQHEIKYGLRPVCTSLKTQQQPTRTIPEGCYDTGDGFYNPRTRCVTSPTTGQIIRIPTISEARWIAKNCRKAWDEPCGYRSAMHKNLKSDDVNYAPLLIKDKRRISLVHRKKASIYHKSESPPL